jgi:AraC-like DNA-binding protein
MVFAGRRIDLGNSLKSSIRQTSDCQNFAGSRVLIRELPSIFEADHSCGISHYFFGYRPTADEPGKTVFTCLDTNCTLVPKHDGPFIAAGARCAIEWKGAEGIVANFHFHPLFIEEIATSLRLDLGQLSPMRRLVMDDPLESLCRILMREVEGGCKHGSSFFEALNRALATTILKRLIPTRPAFQRDARIERAVQFLEQNFRDNISIDRVARVAGLSRYHFFRMFHLSVGMPPHEYLIKCRLREARRLIALYADHRSLAEVAVETGFSDQTHLTRHFRREFGHTPGRWRQQQLIAEKSKHSRPIRAAKHLG